uniref:Ribonuclease HII n=1 Tax=Desertifilum tharense IPPAS B-1220 TaxID=1781255 RepID=A0ACD5GT36_9CYAN
MPIYLGLLALMRWDGGTLFESVVAAAAILPETMRPTLVRLGVKDSKQLSGAKRQRLACEIRAIAIDCQVGLATVAEIDELNILQASLLAMRRAVEKLQVKPQLCLIDGNQLIPGLELPQQTIVGGDRENLAIAAASIVAKVWRDRLIVRLSTRYPEYDLAANKGYGTQRHRLALQQYGLSPLHRQSFRLR